MRKGMLASAALAVLALGTMFSGPAASASEQQIAPKVVSSTITISQIATRGPAGQNDQYIELHNISAQPVSLSNWSVKACLAGTQVVTELTFPAGTMLQPQGQISSYLLLVNPTGYSRAVGEDADFFITIPDSGGVMLANQFGSKIDSVGFSSNACASRTPAVPQNANLDQASLRVQNTGVNQQDFVLYGPSTFQRNQSSVG
ncbi:lamin tail domain-containing protein [Solihabitans fulvus]|uniref:Lamin tail domain-containing protein n=1 Tax=Solihabitans fulvus TaxID=1892852 RepID=A0A5B2WW31_9PSEU|nr:lamin tail domain-containing protein [Solihabitans fulvus]KAA2254656.1 lamin tail domain-containing protein [Solihabitans fulvus]